MVTSGQPYVGVSSGPSSSLVFQAGRHGSSVPAAAFNQGLADGDAHVMGLQDAYRRLGLGEGYPFLVLLLRRRNTLLEGYPPEPPGTGRW